MMARIPPAVVETMRSAIAPLDTDEMRAIYRAGDFPRADAVKDLDMRYRWDLYYAAEGWRLTADLDGLSDAHIDTALRAVVRPLVGA